MEDSSRPYTEIIELIKKWESFKKSSPDGSISDFGRWLSNEVMLTGHSSETQNFIVDTAASMEDPALMPNLSNRAMAGAMLGRLTQFVRNYTKIPFQRVGLGSMDEFKILSLIDRMKNPNKSMLSHASLMEFTTINDMLKRLEKKGWIKQAKDERDRRQSRVMLTENGQLFIRQVYTTLANIQPGLMGDLSEAEQSQLMGLLIKLNNFHTNYFNENYKK